MRFSPITWTGFCLVAVGVLTFGGWALWSATRTYIPVNMPIPMAVGHVQTPEFAVNLNMPYNIRIEAQKTISFDTLNCMMGMAPEPQKCERPSVIDAAWTLRSYGKVVAQGSSRNETGGAWAADTIERQIGSFHGRSGQRYLLDVNILSDGTSLEPARPRLRVEVTRDIYEANAWTTVFLFWPCAFVAIVGLVLFLVAAIRNMRQRGTASVEI